ncbi:Ubiquitin carboxyl-terminal hydrolase 17 [Fukomys damarensis]|uniref:Ubiquitin carboxyl-terminal hydrolase 17 n=1 Tax=Fukomys damarensis TaxID=885580 RepID=A0A091D4U0_FUKDA|nr:Ubiquitin carboxyl-terminal hydrolase 17 [Fukomys damarensis]
MYPSSRCSHAGQGTANPTELPRAACGDHSKLREQGVGTETEWSTLEDYRFHQEQNRPETALNLRTVECTLPADAVMIHPSKHTARLKVTRPEQENFWPTNSGRPLTARESVHPDRAPFLGGRAAAPKTEKKKNKQGKRTALVL